jgi:hypothetical protein
MYWLNGWCCEYDVKRVVGWDGEVHVAYEFA